MSFGKYMRSLNHHFVKIEKVFMTPETSLVFFSSQFLSSRVTVNVLCLSSQFSLCCCKIHIVGVIQYIIFCVCFLLFDIMINPLYQHVADLCTIVCIYAVYSFVHLVASSFLTIVNQAAMNIFYKSLWLYIYIYILYILKRNGWVAVGLALK